MQGRPDGPAGAERAPPPSDAPEGIQVVLRIGRQGAIWVGTATHARPSRGVLGRPSGPEPGEPDRPVAEGRTRHVHCNTRGSGQGVEHRWTVGTQGPARAGPPDGTVRPPQPRVAGARGGDKRPRWVSAWPARVSQGAPSSDPEMKRAARIPIRQEGVPAPREMRALVSHAVHLGRPEDPHPRPEGGSAAQLCVLGAPARRRVSQGTPLQTYSGGGMHRSTPVA